MPELRVLHLTQMDLSPLPSSICFLKNLHSLSLEQSKLEDLSFIGELECLEILSLSGSDFELLPKEVGQLTRLQSLDLSDCDKLKVIAPHVLGRLSKLEELYLANSFVQWEHEERGGDDQQRASLAELMNLKKLVALEVCIGDIQMIPTGLFLENLKKYKIYIGDVAENHVDDYFDSSRMVKLQLNTSGLNVDYSVKEQLFNKTEELYLEGLNHVENVINELYDEGFQHLRYLSVKKAPDVGHIIYSAEMFPLNAFPALEELFLHKLVCLDTVFQGWITKSSLTKLTEITVGFCERVQNLFSCSIARQLVQLQHIDVQHCDGMKEVVDDHEEQERRHDIIAAELSLSGSLEFGEQLRSLRLQHLPKLIGFSRSCDSLSLFKDKVVNSKMEELMLFSIQVSTIWTLSSSFSVRSLVNLKIEGCNELKYLFSLSMARGLENLRFLRVRDCEKMEIVIFSQNGEEEEGKHNLSFLKLESLYMSGLPELVGFYEGSCSVKFPSLKELNISNCQKMEGFIINHTPTDEDALFFNGQVVLPRIKSAKLHGMPRMKKIWEDELDAESFHLLNTVVVDSCSKLSNIFPFRMRERLQKLGFLRISDCRHLGKILESQPAGSDQELLLFPELYLINLFKLPSLTRFCSGISLEFPSLRELRIDKCPWLEMSSPRNVHREEAHLFDAKVAFPDLEILELNSMDRLNKIWDANVDAHSFCKLNQVLLLNCEKLENVFPSSMLENGRLQSLELLKIWNCRSMKEIFEPQSRDVGASEETTIKISLPSLTGVKLIQLPQLQCFSPQMYSIECPLLTSLEVVGCNQVKIFASEDSNKENQQQMQPLFWVNKATFSSIEELKLENNGLMEEIWHGKTNQVKVDDIVFRKLKSMQLDVLPKLASFCSSNRKFEFPTLDDVIVKGCPRMEFFSKQESLTPKLQTVKWMTKEDDEGIWRGDLNATIQEMFTQKVGYSILEKLNLSEYQELIPIWNKMPRGILLIKILRVLEICNIDNLRYALTPSMALGLEQLIEFRVINCEAIEQVIADNGEGHHQEIMLFPKMEFLKLQDLTNSQAFVQEILLNSLPSHNLH